MHLNRQQLQIIKDHQPVQRSEKSLLQAAVAIILREGEQGLEFLMMQRAKHESDPWSGQMSFPGGKIDPQDSSAKAAAIRETREEVAIELREEDYLGQLDDLYGLKVDNQFSVHVACFIFKPQRTLEPVGNYEVEDLVWLPASFLDNKENAIDFYHPHKNDIRMPAVLINADKEQILWGLSLRMLSVFYALLDWPLSVLSERDIVALEAIEKRNLVSSELDQSTQKILSRRG